ncbi:MAG: threonine synthase [Candidatus Riflebacteria bacterium]|nr:threonine synthase [Candidatus Riflebacteria bacterium]
MKFYSTRKSCEEVNSIQAVLAGLAPDGGLYIPSNFPNTSFIGLAPETPFVERAKEILWPFFSADLDRGSFNSICEKSFDFPVPLRFRNQQEAVLELFNGPTLAFKDFGARFLAEFLERFGETQEKPVTVLVATSGDTGGAVAAAFFNRPGIRVFVLFPKGRVSDRQRAQLTCWGKNVFSYAVNGTFDDCQKLVKAAFSEVSICAAHRLTTANSINLGRVLPQIVYHSHAASIFYHKTGEKPVYIVPTGNLGNTLAAFWAKEMGAPIGKIVAAVNENRAIPDALISRKWTPRHAIQTLANAMDVGNPSNMERLIHLFGNIESLSQKIQAFSVSDSSIQETIRNSFFGKGEILCPHTAVAEYVRTKYFANDPAIIVSTASPAKFETIVEPLIGKPVEIPPKLLELLSKPLHEKVIDPDLSNLDWDDFIFTKN